MTIEELEGAVRRTLIEGVAGPLTFTPKLTSEGPLYWTAEYTRRVRLPGDTVEIVGSVSAYGLAACLEALRQRLTDQDAALLRHLLASRPVQEEAPGDAP